MSSEPVEFGVVALRLSRVRVHVKNGLRRVVPHRYRPLVRRLYSDLTWRAFTGDAVGCNCCGGRFRRFRLWSDDAGKRFPMCPRCGSLGRHRVDWLFLRESTDLCEQPTRVLHVAPEPCLQRCLESLPNVSYISGDFDSALAMERMDITDIRHPDESFDAIVCNHVLHYVDDDRQALGEFRRVLRPGGWALLQVPVDLSRAVTLEDPRVRDPRERARIFGHPDHARVYGSDYAERLEEAGFEVTIDDFIATVPESRVRALGLDKGETIYFCRRL